MSATWRRSAATPLAPRRGPTGNRGVTGVVRMLNVMEPAVERRLLASGRTDPQLAREIRRAMFGADVAACEERPFERGLLSRTAGHSRSLG